MKMEGFPSTWCPPRLVIPAHAGIQVCCAELAWIPAFAGMTEPRRASWFSSPNGYFQRRTRRTQRKENLTAKNANPSFPRTRESRFEFGCPHPNPPALRARDNLSILRDRRGERN